MRNGDTSRVELLADDHAYSMDDVCVLCRVEQHWVIEVIENGVIENSSDGYTIFTQWEVDRLVRAVRMQRDFELHTENIALVLDLMETIEEQRRELELLKRQAGVRATPA